MSDGEPRLTDFRLKDLDAGIDLGPYTAAYRAAPDATKAAILDALQRVDDDTPLLYALLGTNTDLYQMKKEQAGYERDADGEQLCGNCTFAYRDVLEPEYICAKVRGDVRPQDSCRLWEGKDGD